MQAESPSPEPAKPHWDATASRSSTNADAIDPVQTYVLLGLARGGDPAAERRLHDRLQPKLIAAARRHRLTRALARLTSPEDVAQEVWIRLYTSDALASFKNHHPGALDALITTVTDRTIRSILRRSKAVKRGSGAEIHPAGSAYDTLATAAARDPTPTSTARVHETLNQAQQTLLPRGWEAWRLNVVEDFSAAEIAARTGSSESAVRSLLHRANESLRKLLVERAR